MSVLSLRSEAPGLAPVPQLPRAPQNVRDTGLSESFLVELVARTMYQSGLTRLTELAAHVCLPATVLELICQHMRRETLIEVLRRGHNDSDVQFDLTQSGLARAADWLSRNRYVGPAPVTLEAYTECVRKQSVTTGPVTAVQAQAAFADLVVPAHLVGLLGTAVNSGRPMLLYGEAGSGKTYLAERLQRLLGGAVAVPHAICVHGEVIRVFDAQCHRVASGDASHRAAGAGPSSLDGRSRPDSRWVLCQRPCVVTGGELTLEMLDLSFDARAGYYEAPPHFKANNGLFIVDDLGRQVITPRELMNRWIVPMERRHDHLMLRNGGKFTIPFDMVLVFSSNLHPAQLEDAAFLRRLGHKIHVEALDAQDYRQVFERACAAEGVPFDAAALDALMGDYHGRTGRPLLACYPRDLLHLIASRAAYLAIEPSLSPELIDWAWHAYFATVTGAPPLQSGEAQGEKTHYPE
jgi:predicted ATPase with chaperone activity